MKELSCPQEVSVMRAARTGQWDEPLKAHVAACTHCREVAQASRFLQTLAQLPEQRPGENPALPEAGLVWWKAQLTEKQRAAERAQRPLEWIEGITQAIVALGVAGGFAWSWFRIQAQFPALLSSLWSQLWKTTWSPASPVPALDSWLILPALMALCAVAIFLVYPFLVEE